MLKTHCGNKTFASLNIILHLWNFYTYMALKIFAETILAFVWIYSPDNLDTF